MNVIELINKLEQLPNDAPVVSIYDGYCDIDIDLVYLSKGGRVILINEYSSIYDEENKPMDGLSVTMNESKD